MENVKEALPPQEEVDRRRGRMTVRQNEKESALKKKIDSYRRSKIVLKIKRNTGKLKQVLLYVNRG